LGFGVWGLGFGGWGIGPNPQSPIPNPQSPIPNPQYLKNKNINIKFFKLNKNAIIINKNI
jgi:hypothetical protein